jgi:hypothetical protein
VQDLKIVVIALAATLLPVAAQSADTAQPPAQTLPSTSALSGKSSAAPAKCLVAEVNPVTGNAVCVNPVGAPVDRPSVTDLKPCKKRPHDTETGTVYEHWSSC